MLKKPTTETSCRHKIKHTEAWPRALSMTKLNSILLHWVNHLSPRINHFYCFLTPTVYISVFILENAAILQS